jgi:hypothetical protein
MANKSKNALKKSIKFLYSSSTSPSVTSPNANTPKIENMKKMSIKSMKTFMRDGIEN